MKQHIKTTVFLLSSLSIYFLSCEKKEIQFGTDLGEPFTTIIETDTVSIKMGTFLSDSFPTNSLPEFLMGTYEDPVLGVVATKTFLQFLRPAELQLEANAVYDSTSIILKLDKSYYGDTSVPFELIIRELNGTIAFSYNSSLFNSSYIPEKSTPIAIVNVKINPSKGDSVSVRISDTKGQELFSKIRQQSAEMLSADAFLNYFKGVSISSSSGLPSAVYSYRAVSDSVYIRMHYHTNTPYHESRFKDFALDPSIYFNQILTNRSGTPFTGSGQVIPSENSDNYAVTQSATGVLLKMSFPSLRNILKLDPTVKLLKATLVLQVKPQSFNGLYPLPSLLYLATTDGSNVIGSFLADSSGSSLLTGNLMEDEIYSSGTQYSFNITPFVNAVLKNAGTETASLFLMHELPGSTSRMNRVVINNSMVSGNRSKLVLSMLTLKKS
jgi:hypothetical protein